MIYLLVPVLLLTTWQFILKARREGTRRVFKNIAVAAVSGLLAGIFIGVGARAGMAAIPVANGSAPSFTTAGTFAVVLTFSSYGIALGIVYEGLFRRLLRAKGLVYGALLMLCSWYPLAQAAAQQLTGQTTLVSMFVVSGLITAFMWLPFGLTLEALLQRIHTNAAP
jgi:hypothetical protein